MRRKYDHDRHGHEYIRTVGGDDLCLYCGERKKGVKDAIRGRDSRSEQDRHPSGDGGMAGVSSADDGRDGDTGSDGLGQGSIPFDQREDGGVPKDARSSREGSRPEGLMLYKPDPQQPHAYLRRNPHDTEVKAAERAQVRSGTHRFAALEFIALNEGATSDEISRWLESQGKYVPPNQVASRVLELVEMGWVEDSGERRLTRRKNEAIVWRMV